MDTDDLVPARMINEVAYCPRLFALEHVHGEWAENQFTVDGKRVHRRVDEASTVGLPEPEDSPDKPATVRQVFLSDPDLGMVAKIDLVVCDGPNAEPIDYKRGPVPDVEEGAYEPERVQVCVQALLLRAHGYAVDRGWIWFAESRRRVEVLIDKALVDRTLELRDLARAITLSPTLPAPLVDSPKCRGCSLVGICLPDEVNLLSHRTDHVRNLVPARDDGVPLYVRAMGGSIGKHHDEIVVKEKGQEIGRARLADTSRVVVLGNVSVTSPVLQELADRGIPLAVHGMSGWFYGLFTPASGYNVTARVAQHAAARDPARTLALARRFIAGKIANQRTLLRRNARDLDPRVLTLLNDLAEQAELVDNYDSLLGVEGNAARIYFENFALMLKPDLRAVFEPQGRNRRPPKDPTNALLSFAYAVLVREIAVVVHQVGLDPHVGFLHRLRPGRPSLALDLIEEFRPLVADSAVLVALNTATVTESDFLIHPTGVALTDNGRRAFIRVLERRLDELVTHPVFQTRLSYRRIFEVQARLLGRVLQGDLTDYPEFTTR